MANPDARLKYLFLHNSEDPVTAVPKFEAFLNEVGVPEGNKKVERDFFYQWSNQHPGDGVLFTSRERIMPFELYTRAFVFNKGEELANQIWKPPPLPGFQNLNA